VTLKILGQVRAPALPAVTGEIRRRLLAAFATAGIELPRPRSVVLAQSAQLNPFAGGAPGPGPSQEELSSGSE
jgi:hypothetical protein